MIIYGLRNGTIGALELTLTEDEAVILWEEECEAAPVSVIKTTELSGQQHLILSRDDGTIEMYLFNQTSCLDLVYQTKEKETITGIACGNFTSS